jgi:hypothetical protein
MSHQVNIQYQHHQTYWGNCDNKELRKIYHDATVALVEQHSANEVLQKYPILTKDTLQLCEHAAKRIQAAIAATTVSTTGTT